MIWHPIPGFTGLYEIRRDGLMRNIKNGPHGTHFCGTINANGYVYTCLIKESSPHSRQVHRLLWEAFKGPIPTGMSINHKNGMKSDNRLRNLEIVTPAENVLHYYRQRRKITRKGLPWHHGFEGKKKSYLDRLYRYSAKP